MTANGYGKRTIVEDYRTTGRGGQGVISIQVNERNGPVVGALQVTDKHDMMLISDGGTLVRMPVHEVSVIGRNTQGTPYSLVKGESMVALQKVEELPEVLGELVEAVESRDNEPTSSAEEQPVEQNADVIDNHPEEPNQ